MHCTVVCDVEPKPQQLMLQLPAAATIGEALAAARGSWQTLSITLPIDWEQVRVGVWGVEQMRDTVIHEGDRIEIYRTLPNDPRQARRQRAAAARATKKARAR